MKAVNGSPVRASFHQPVRQGVLAAASFAFLLVGVATLVTYSNRAIYEAQENGYYSYDSWFVLASRLMYAVIAVGSLFAFVRIGRAGVYVTDAGVTFRNILRSHHLRWDEIVDPQPPAGLPGLSLELNDGRVVRSSLFGRDNPLYRQEDVDRVLTAIDRLRPR